MSCINLKKSGKRQQSGGESWWFPDGERSMKPRIYGFCNHPSPRPGGTMVDTGKKQGGWSIYECPFCNNRVFGGPEELNPCAVGNYPEEIETVDTREEFDMYNNIAKRYPVALPAAYEELEKKFYPYRKYAQYGGSKKTKKSKKAKKSKKSRKSKKKMRKSKNKRR